MKIFTRKKRLELDETGSPSRKSTLRNTPMLAKGEAEISEITGL